MSMNKRVWRSDPSSVQSGSRAYDGRKYRSEPLQKGSTDMKDACRAGKLAQEEWERRQLLSPIRRKVADAVDDAIMAAKMNSPTWCSLKRIDIQEEDEGA